MKPYTFEDKHILVTGASGGLGSALVKLLADRGARLAITSRSDKALTDLTSQLPPKKGAVAITADLSKPGEAARLAHEAMAALGHIDVLINNAGVGYFALMEEATEENIRHLFEVNTVSPLMLLKALLPEMQKRGSGRIINILSCAGRVPIPTVAVYGGSKSALAVMTNTMRLELEPKGIDIINIYPGTVSTAFEEHAFREEERPGLCPHDICGEPRFRIAQKVLKAAAGPPGEVWLERVGKWFSTAALIWPDYVDRRLASLRDQVIEKKSLKKRPWRLFQVESAIACNLKCVMCPWREIAKKAENRGVMTPEIWAAIKPYLDRVQSVDFTGGGEPLLQPHLAQWIAEASQAGCETGFLSNGLLLKEEKLKKILAAGINWICISMDGATADMYNKIRVGSDFDRVCENVANIARLRKGSLPKTMINFVLMDMNAHQMEDIVQLADRLGVDQVNFKQCDVIRGQEGKGFGLFASEETKEIRRLQKSLDKARRLAKKLNIETTAFAFMPQELAVCEQDPRDSLFVRHDGTVAPCINLALGGPTTFLGKEVTMPSVHYGKLPDDDLMDLWETESCQFYRKKFQERVQKYDNFVMNGLLGGSGGNRAKVMEDARKAMPAPPEGCNVCHYLYDI
ncbi:MAG: SDR family NAD(P)-dependent oxidoreductase [Desulfobacterales bacterium]|jgi:short-subunit dehydrogenase/MoaA/NifB/PqqE/SkfB family radical SAM enzyme